MFRLFIGVLFFGLLIQTSAFAKDRLKIAAAIDLQFVVPKLEKAFQETDSQIEFSESYGSSGSLYNQIKYGADFDLFLSADAEFAKQIVFSGLSSGETQTYARSILVVCGAKNLRDLKSEKYKKIAVANPDHAPYGRIAVEALKNSGVLAEVKSKLIYGENVAQVAEYIQLGAVQAALIAQSLTYAVSMKSVSCELVESKLYHPLDQSLVVLKNSKNIEKAKVFAKFLRESKAQAILNKNGFRSIGSL